MTDSDMFSDELPDHWQKVLADPEFRRVLHDVWIDGYEYSQEIVTADELDYALNEAELCSAAAIAKMSEREIEDGFGSTWSKCSAAACDLQVVRPGKAQCDPRGGCRLEAEEAADDDS